MFFNPLDWSLQVFRWGNRCLWNRIKPYLLVDGHPRLFSHEAAIWPVETSHMQCVPVRFSCGQRLDRTLDARYSSPRVHKGCIPVRVHRRSSPPTSCRSTLFANIRSSIYSLQSWFADISEEDRFGSGNSIQLIIRFNHSHLIDFH